MDFVKLDIVTQHLVENNKHLFLNAASVQIRDLCSILVSSVGVGVNRWESISVTAQMTLRWHRHCVYDKQLIVPFTDNDWCTGEMTQIHTVGKLDAHKA